jgi:hypothetical protein
MDQRRHRRAAKGVNNPVERFEFIALRPLLPSLGCGSRCFLGLLPSRCSSRPARLHVLKNCGLAATLRIDLI